MNLSISNFRLGIGIPNTWTHVPSAFFETFALMEKPDFLFIRERNGPLDALRNNIVRRAVNGGCSHLLMIDTDHELHPLTIKSLLSRKKPIVAAQTFRRYPPFDPIMLKGRVNNYSLIEDWEPGALIEVDATGTGIIMYETWIFDEIKPPWFKFRRNPNKKYRDDPNKDIGEDISFCSRLQKAGFKIYVDTAVPCKHISMFSVCEKTYRFYKKIKETQRELYGKSQFD